MKSDLIQSLIEYGAINYVDMTFARKGNSEVEKLFLATVMMSARQGHIAMDLASPPLPENIPEELASDWKKELQEGAKSSYPFIFQKEGLYYLERNAFYEKRLLNSLSKLNQPPRQLSLDLSSIPVNDKQQKAIKNALTCSISLLTGGPGTGKTYTASHIIQAFSKIKKEPRITIMAPTGKAASHLASKVPKEIQIESRTLHSLLGIRSHDDFSRSDFFLSRDLIIVDECSMIDLPLFSALLSSLTPDCHLVLMGDKNQLPPVETGHVFHDLCALKELPTAHLEQSMRTDKTPLLELATAINQSDAKKIQTLFAQDHPEISTSFQPPKIESYLSHFPSSFDTLESALNAQQTFCLLTPIRNGPNGVNALNEKIVESLRKKHTSPYFVAPILITKTDYKRGLYNGEIGLLISGPEKDTAYISGREIPAAFLPPYEYAYALSIHKSQGCEYTSACLIIPEKTEALTKELLYTAVTRVKEHLTIAGSEKTFYASLTKTTHRVSGITRIKFQQPISSPL